MGKYWNISFKEEEDLVMMRKKLICSLFSLGMILQYILSPQAVVVIRAQEEGLQEFVQEELTPDAAQYMEDEWEDIQ